MEPSLLNVLRGLGMEQHAAALAFMREQSQSSSGEPIMDGNLVDELHDAILRGAPEEEAPPEEEMDMMTENLIQQVTRRVAARLLKENRK